MHEFPPARERRANVKGSIRDRNALARERRANVNVFIIPDSSAPAREVGFANGEDDGFSVFVKARLTFCDSLVRGNPIYAADFGQRKRGQSEVIGPGAANRAEEARLRLLRLLWQSGMRSYGRPI